jgi:hypothetical protein
MPPRKPPDVSTESWIDAQIREAAEMRRLNRGAAGGPPTSQAPLEPEAIVAAWRARRGER